LFVADLTGTYAVSEYRWGVMSSILGLYLVSFVMGNFAVLKIREKDSALRAAREELVRLGKDSKLGRLSGTVLPGQIEIAEVFGRGGMGEVYAGRRITDNRPVAVKVLHAHHQQPQIIERFRREVEAARLLPPSFVAEVIDLGRTDEGYHYIVMERLEGEDLGAYLRRRGVVTLEDGVTLCRAVATIIDAAHAAGIIHRDLKPSNIYLVGDLRDAHPVRLLDFGISRLRFDEDAGTLTATAEVLGSPGYISPEQALGQPALIGPPTDVFALGAVMYRALTGCNAFPSRSVGAAVYEALYHRPKEPSAVRPGLPPEVDDVLAIALAKSSEDRFQRAGELADALEAAAGGATSATLRQRAAAVRDRSEPLAHTLTSD
jgi:eukaryotic-like serine/threonine-protein kinase